MKARCSLLCALLLTGGLSLVGCGGSDGAPLDAMGGAGTGDTGPVRATDCSAGAELELWKIDDFELGAATGAFTNNEVCARCQDIAPEDEEELFACQDRCRASQSPTDFDKPLPAELIPGGRCGSRYALHIESERFFEWGGIVGFPFAPAVDVSDYTGIAFWGRVAWGTRTTVRASVLDPETDATFVEPRCSGESDLDEFEDACDAYGNYAVMDGNWKFYKIPFIEMRQRGYGHIAPFLDLGAITQASIEFGLGEWDFWIDDIAFYRAKGEGE